MSTAASSKKDAAAAAASGDLGALLAELSSAAPVALSVERGSRPTADNASEWGKFSSTASLTPSALFAVDRGVASVVLSKATVTGGGQGKSKCCWD